MTINKKGGILILVMVFLLVSMISSVGIYSAVYNLSKMQSIGAVRRVKGYYAALGALRYTLCAVTPNADGTLS